MDPHGRAAYGTCRHAAGVDDSSHHASEKRMAYNTGPGALQSTALPATAATLVLNWLGSEPIDRVTQQTAPRGPLHSLE